MMCFGRRSWKTRLSLVDPCQLFHDLNNLVHGGFTLHAAAVIDLKSNRTKQWAPPLLLWRKTARTAHRETSGKTSTCTETGGTIWIRHTHTCLVILALFFFWICLFWSHCQKLTLIILQPACGFSLFAQWIGLIPLGFLCLNTRVMLAGFSDYYRFSTVRKIWNSPVSLGRELSSAGCGFSLKLPLLDLPGWTMGRSPSTSDPLIKAAMIYSLILHSGWPSDMKRPFLAVVYFF